MEQLRRKRLHRGALTIMVALGMTVFPSVLSAAEATEAVRLTVAKAVSMALEEHPDLRTAQERLRMAAVTLDGARAAFQPELSAGASAVGGLQGGSGDTSSQSLDATTDMKLNLYRGGADNATVEQARSNLDANVATLERQRETLVSETVDRYLATLTARELVAVREKNLAWNRAHQERVRAQYEAGERSVTDVYQQDAETEKASYELTSVRGARDAALLRLLEVIGVTEGVVTELADVADVSSAALLPSGGAGLITEEAVALRADLIAQRSAIRTADQGIALARAAAKPTVDLTASVGSGYSSLAGGGVGDQIGSDGLGASVGVSFSIPLWDRHVARNAATQAVSQREIERATLQSLERQVRLDVGTALAGFQTAQAQAASASKQRESAAKALEAAEARYDAGAATLLEVTQAKNLLLEAANGVVEARYSILRKAVALAYAAGNPDKIVALLSVEEGWK